MPCTPAGKRWKRCAPGRRTLACAGLLLGLAGCSGAELLNTLFLPRTGYRRTAGIAYGPGRRQRLDVYRPTSAAGSAPLVVFFYGGRWQSGERENFRFVGQAITALGAVAVIPDYRLFPDTVFPAWVRDGASAVRWARQNARRFGADPDRILLAGHSAGAHTAVLLALDERYLRDAGVPRSAIRGAAGIAGPYDFLPFRDADLRALFGPPEQWPATQPIRFVDGDEPPLLLLQGGADRTVDAHNAPNLEARVRAAGGEVRRIVYPRLGHVATLAVLAAPLRGIAPVWRDLGAFIRARSAAPPVVDTPPFRP